jgi:hypothetical protein
MDPFTNPDTVTKPDPFTDLEQDLIRNWNYLIVNYGGNPWNKHR